MTMNPIDAVMGRIAEIGARFSDSSSRSPGTGFAERLEAAQQSRADAAADLRDATSVGMTLGSFLGRPGTSPISGVRVAEDWVAGLPPQGREYADDIRAAAEEAGIDPALLASVVWAESQFVATAESDAGALGLTQLMPATAELLGVDPLDPAQNLRGGAQFLADMLNRYGGDVELALAAYNAGPGAVDAAGGAPVYTEDYIARVLGNLDGIGREPQPPQVSIADIQPVVVPETAPVPSPAAGTIPEVVVPGGIADRIMDAVEHLRNQPPPQRMVIEIPELDGARITVALRGGSVYLSAREVDSAAVSSWLTSVQEALERHGLDTGRDGRDGQAPPDDEPSESLARLRRDVIMEGADA